MVTHPWHTLWLRKRLKDMQAPYAPRYEGLKMTEVGPG
jgi:hypothetical protein